MNRPILVLQYPSQKEGRTIALAATRDIRAFRAFREVVLEDALLEVMSNDDEVIHAQNRAELKRLEQVFSMLFPDLQTPI